MEFKRTKYLNQLIKAKENGFPKVITGLRRCGKSFLLNTIYRGYLEKTGVPSSNIIYIDLEDASNYEYWDPLNLYDHVINAAKDKNGNYVRKQREVDFIATRGSEKYYIQVALSIDSEKTYFREKKSIGEIKDFNKKIIVVKDPIKIRRDEKGIETIGAVEFLLNENYLS